MKDLTMYNVGDGLHLAIFRRGEPLQIDYGGNSRFVYQPFNPGRSFMLSHFHNDHYNGIMFNASKKLNNWNLETLYYPIFPNIKRKTEFYQCLFAMNIWRNKEHSIQSNVFAAISSLNNNKKIELVPLKKGMVFRHYSDRYEVLWPKETIDSEEANTDIERAIEAFNKALKVDPLLKNIYEKVGETIEKDIEEFDSEKSKLNFFDYNKYREEFEAKKELDLNDEGQSIVDNANKSLKKAANRLSLAFRQEDNVLFLGDLESEEVKSVVEDLWIKGPQRFGVIVTPHHGTRNHFHSSLLKFRADFCLASAGSKSCENLEGRYYEIGKRFLNTQTYGNITIYKSFNGPGF